MNESLNGWIKEELFIDFHLEECRKREEVYATLERYVKYFNEQRPCYALNYDTPAGFRKRFFRGEIPRKNTFEKRELSEEPKFVKKYRKQAYLKDVSTFENEND